jgi:pre-rRNA-processing protein TSR4
MADYDSDSSLGEASEYTETGVLLGYATKESTDDSVSHLGGHPVSLLQTRRASNIYLTAMTQIWHDPKTTPSASQVQCKCCKGYMSLLLQLNGDLPKQFPEDERRLHIFCCRKKTCSRKAGSIRVLREVKRYRTDRNAAKPAANKVVAKQPKENLGAVLFGASSPTPVQSNPNPFSSATTSSQDTINPFASLASTSTLASKPPQPPTDTNEPPTETFAQKLRLSSPDASPAAPSSPWPSQSAFPPPFPQFNLDADYESLAPEPTTNPSTPGPSKSKYDAEDSGPSKETEDMTLDTTFHKFARRLAQNPEQVLRYEYNGQPLLYSGTDGVASRFIVPHNKSGAVQGMPRCESCGAGRVFELQLVPGLIEVLEEGEEVGVEEGMEWGTVILGVCARNCAVVGEVAFREEWVGVQWEERVKYKK